MNKFLSLLIATLFLCSCANKIKKEEEKFVNPLFYKTMYPYSRNSWETKLTPTKQIKTNPIGEVFSEDCELLENTPTYVTLKCIPYYNTSTTKIYKYSIFSKESYGYKIRLNMEDAYFTLYIETNED